MKNKSNKAGDLDLAAATSKHVPAKAESIQVTKSSENNDELDHEKKELLAECETDIEKNLRGTFVLGWRLEQIRDQRLYTETHKTFDAYCRDRWDFSKTHANRHIQAYLCEKHLKQVKDVDVYVPTKESQVRFIADLEPKQWVDVASKVKENVGDKEASAGDFSKTRQELFPKPKAEKKTSEPTKPVPETSTNIVPVKFDTKMVSIPEIQKLVKSIYYIYGSSGKKQEGLNMFAKLERWLEDWAEWESNSRKEQEAA